MRILALLCVLVACVLDNSMHKTLAASVKKWPAVRICAEYIAAGMNDLAVTDSTVTETPDYRYDDEDDDESNRSSEESEATIEYSKPMGVMQCSRGQHFCFSVWKMDEQGNATVVRQGCWQTDDQQASCANRKCVNAMRTISNNHRFCCCSGSMCNQNTTTTEQDDHVVAEDDDDDNDIGGTHQTVQSADNRPSPLAPATIWRSPIVWICVAVTVTMFISAAIFLACSSTKKAEPELAPLAPSGPGYSSNMYNVDNLKLCAMIGQGKYGTVWKGMVNEKPVAVKIFPGQYKQYFVNEKNIYSLSLMDSPSLLEYYGCDTRRTMNDNIEYLLVMSLAPFGCLQDWLIENSCSFAIFTKMAKSVARGVGHLHTEMKKDEMLKPCICHRDINTRNILVKADLSCCLADFGFALKTYGPRYEWKGEIALAETKSINEVGTLRYMAPEVLEGAVNLRDCETALKQIDVYALGLVLWELCVRCKDWYPTGQNPPSYAAPYEAEIGKHPSFEHMQILVSRHKARPMFPPNWGETSASSRIAQETCEDCWDHDAEARLTALCVEERLHELSVLGPSAQTTCRTSPSISKSHPTTANTIATNNTHQLAQMIAPHSNLYQNNVTTIITPPNQITPMVNHSHNESTNDTVISAMSSPPVSILRGSILHSKRPSALSSNRCYVPNSRNDNHYTRGDDGAASIEDLIASSVSSDSISSSDVPARGWQGVRALIEKNLFKRNSYNIQREDRSTSNDERLTVTIDVGAGDESPVRTVVVASQRTSPQLRPSRLDLMPQNGNNSAFSSSVSSSSTSSSISSVTSVPATFVIADDGYKKPPGDSQQAFAIIAGHSPRIVISKSATTVKQLSSLEEALDASRLKRQRSLEVFREVFGAKGSIERLRDPSQRVKTPGDVPPSVRKIRASKTLSLYDDRMMDTSAGRNTM